MDGLFFTGMGGNLLAGGLSMIGQAGANKANEMHSLENMNWQKMMSDTAHLREVQDLKNAGLNPILSVNAGAGTGSGAQSSNESVTSGMASSIKDAILFKQAQEKQNVDINKTQQDTATGESAERLNNALRDKAETETRATKGDARRSEIMEKIYNRLFTGAKDAESSLSKATDALGEKYQNWEAQKAESKQQAKSYLLRMKRMKP